MLELPLRVAAGMLRELMGSNEVRIVQVFSVQYSVFSERKGMRNAFIFKFE